MAVNLFQLTDSSLPVGSFVYSFGMESAIKHKALVNIEDVERYLTTFIDQLLSFDFPFLDAGYDFQNKPTEWPLLCETYEAMLMNPPLQKSSLVLGKNWMKLVCSIYDTKELQDLNTAYKALNLPMHQIIMIGLSSSALQIDREAMREIHLYNTLRDQISALTRLGIVGPQAGQQLLTPLLKTGNEKIKTYKTKHYTKASKSAYLQEILQLNHHKLYTRLFQN